MSFLERLRFFSAPDESNYLEWAIQLTYLLSESDYDNELILGCKRIIATSWHSSLVWYVVSNLLNMIFDDIDLDSVIYELINDKAWTTALEFCGSNTTAEIFVSPFADYVQQNLNKKWLNTTVKDASYLLRSNLKEFILMVEPAFVFQSNVYLTAKANRYFSICNKLRQNCYLVCPKWCLVEDRLIQKVCQINAGTWEDLSVPGSFQLKKSVQLTHYPIENFNNVFFFNGEIGLSSKAQAWRVPVELI